jgi:tetratricopeptide (TPR) repeat protein
MKKTGLAALALVVSSAMFSQTIGEAIKLTTNEQFESADPVYKTLLQNQPNNGEYYFYYGENFFKNDNTEMAAQMYQKGADVNATNPFPYVGLGKVQWVQGKQAEAKSNFFKAQTLAAGKNPIVLMKIAEAYIGDGPVKNVPDAITLLNQAAKLDPKNMEIYILLGDAYLEQNDGSKAVENYEKAAALNPKSPVPLTKQGELYNRAKNYTLALDFYKRSMMVDSSYAPAFRQQAEIYARAGQYKNAVDRYKRYLSLNNNCSARGRYAGFLNRAKEYALSVEAANEAIKCDSNNVYLYRYLAYDYLELKDAPNGLANINKFFKKVTPDKVIPQDYETRARLYSMSDITGKDSLAVLDFNKALQMDTTRKELNNEIAKSYMSMKKYKEAIEIYKKKTEGGKGGINDYYGLARAYYYSKDFVNADSAAAQMIRIDSTQAVGYSWRAKANVQLDAKNEKWAAKPFYEAYISKVKPTEIAANKPGLVDAYTYLAAFSAAKKNYPDTKMYFQKVLEVDPNNAQAKKFMASPPPK